jgi:hypothetical protein
MRLSVGGEGSGDEGGQERDTARHRVDEPVEATEFDLASGLLAARRRQWSAVAEVSAAEHEVAAAAERFAVLRAGRSPFPPAPRAPGRWRRAGLVVLWIGVSAGLLALCLLGTVVLLPGPFVVAPVAVALAGVVIATRRSREEGTPAAPPTGERLPVHDLVDGRRDRARAAARAIAAAAVRSAEEAFRRARERARAADRMAELYREHRAAVARRGRRVAARVGGRRRRGADAVRVRAAAADPA